MSTPLLEIDRLTLRFGSRAVVEELSLTVGVGESLGLVGESGSGKSVTALALMRLMAPGATVSGSIRLDGEELLSLPEAAMRRHRGQSLAMIFQEPMTALNPVMRVGAQIGEAVTAHHPALRRQEVRDRVLRAMYEVALPEPERRIDDYPHQFSGGQRQRLMIAMAFINRPRLLIADEPTTALDVTVQAQVLELLAELRLSHHLAMLFISHDLAVVSKVADRVAVMQAGRIVELGAARDVFLAPQHPYTRRLLASVPTMQTDRASPLATLR